VTGPLDGRRILVTGAATGIGAAAVEVFAAAGATVTATYHRSPPPAALAGRFTWLPADLAVPEQADEAVSAAREVMGGLDVLLHAAGTWAEGPVGEVSAQNLDAMLDANLRTTVFTNQAAFRAMRDIGAGGRVINLGSSEAVIGMVRSASYALAKGAVHSWTRSAAKAWGVHGITVNAVAPAVETPGSDRFRASLGSAGAQMIAQLAKTRPVASSLGPDLLGDPVRDLGPVLVFLASPGSRFLTGQLLSVTGGSLMLGA
jgi:NAD(P)-dependent dehydrogenase (short-subunit alcohol dehydrogenase family)